MGRLLKDALGALRVKDCRIDWVREGPGVVSYYRAIHRPTDTEVRLAGPESHNDMGRRRLLLKLREAVEAKVAATVVDDYTG